MTINPELVTATDLHEAAGGLESQELIPRLVRRLLTRTLGVEGVTMRATEGIRLRGWDGKVTASAGSAYVPVGASVWEVGVGQNPKGKADEDYEKRCKDPLGVDPATSAFVFVTSRRWSGKEEWVKDKMKDGVWREIRVLDADDLHGFLELSPGVHTWISEELGRLPFGVETLERWAEIWSTQTDPPLPLELLLAGRGESAAYLRALLDRDAGVAGVRGGSRDEAMAFIATALLVPPPPPEDPGDEETGAEGADGHEESAGTQTEGAGETAPNASEHTEDKRESSSETATTPEASEDGNGRDAGDGEERGETGEPADLLIGSRVLVVSDPEVWRRLVHSPTPLVLVAATDEGDVAAAVAAGHHVLRPLGPGDGAGRGTLVELPRLERTAAREALEPVFGSFGEADRRAAAARRSLVSLRRSLRRDPQRVRPPWAEPPDSEKLAPLLLGGSWRAGSGDRAKIGELAGEDYPALEHRLARLAATDDPPLRLGDREWHLSSQEDAWDLLSPQLTGEDAGRWRAICLEVLAELDPMLSRAPDKRELAAFRGEARREHSGALRRGLAEGAALLGAAGDQKLSDGTRASDYADSVVGELLAQANADETGMRWQSLAEILPLLAEAAPEIFLTAVEQGVSGEEPLLRLMFGDGEGSSPLGTRSAHTWLLLALEGLCWSEEYLVRAAVALARLEKIDPGGRLGNRPRRSLRAVLLPWVPCTRASVDRRLQALDAIRAADAEIAFELMLAIWPRLQDSSSPTHIPRFRQWQRDSEGGSLPEILEFVSGLVPRALEDAAAEPRRWVKLVGRIAVVPEAEQEQMLSALEQLEPETLGEEPQLELWRAFVDLVERHRTYADAHWAMPLALRDRLAAQAARLEPAQAVERQARLFEHRPDLPDIDRGDYDAYNKALEAARVEAVTTTLEEGGFEAVSRLASASRLPGAVGDALARATGDEHTEAILSLLEGTDAEATLAVGFIRRRNVEEGPQWSQRHAASLAEWPEERQVRFLRALPPGNATSELADSAPDEARARYWADVEPFTSGAEAEALTERLLAAERAWAACELIGLYAPERPGDPDSWRPGAELIIRVLEQALREDPTDALRSGMTSHGVGSLIDRLQELETERGLLARLEWAFEPLLTDDRRPHALHAELAENPDLFVEMVSGVYGRDPEDEDGAQQPGAETSSPAEDKNGEQAEVQEEAVDAQQTSPTGSTEGEEHRAEQSRSEPEAEKREAFFQHAWTVLHHWRRPPGTREDGTLDGEHLKQWVRKARELFAARKRTRIGDAQLGEVVTGVIPGKDGIWPAEPTRELVEELASEPFDDGVYTGRINSRGITTRGVYSGGTSERLLAAGCVADAAVLEGRWPRTAQILRRLQRTYERLADEEDEEAGRLADEG